MVAVPLQQKAEPIVMTLTRAATARNAGFEPLAEAIRSFPAQDPESHARAFCRDRPQFTPQSALEGARVLLLDRLLEDTTLIIVLRDWLWERAWIKSSSLPQVDGPDPLALDGRLKELPKARLDPVTRAIASGTARAELFADADAELEYEQVVRVIAQHAGFTTGGSQPGPWIAALCRSAWRSRLAMRVKAIIMLDVAKTARPSDCRFSNTCSHCSDTCPRLWSNDTGYKPTAGADSEPQHAHAPT